MKRRRVYIYAYTKSNLGDDLFIKSLIERYPKDKFILLGNRVYKDLLATYRNACVYDKFSTKSKILQKLNLFQMWERKVRESCDYMVYIGGSIFMEYEKWTDQYKWYKELFDNEKLFFIGCNWGPCKTELFRENMTKVFSGVKDICFRDKNSYRHFQDLMNVRYAPDILFSTDFPKVKTRNRVFVSVIDCNSKEEGGRFLSEYTDYYLGLVTSIIQAFSMKGYEITLVSFCNDENDPVAIKAIQERIGNNSCVDIVLYNGKNVDEVLNCLAESKYVIASRFHAMILGIAAGKKVLPLIYSNKTLNVLEDINFTSDWIDIRMKQQYDAEKIVNELCINYSYIVSQKIVNSSLEHFMALDKILLS